MVKNFPKPPKGPASSKLEARPKHNPKMPHLTPDHTNQAIAAASLVMGSINKAANDPKASARSLPRALVPAFGIAWNKEVTQALPRDSPNKLLLKLRNSPLPRWHYDRLADLFKAAYAHPYSLIPEWDEWKHLADSCVLDRRFSQGEIATSISFLTAKSVPGPGALAILDAGAVEVIAGAAPSAGPVRTLWRLARTSMTAVSSNEHLPIPESGRTAEVFKAAVKRCQWSLGRTLPSRPIIRRRMGAPGSFGRLGPAQKIGVLKQLKTRPAQVRRFIKDNTHRNLMKQVRGSLPSVASALNCYLQFCQLVDEDPFPVTEGRVLEWRSVFNDTGTYRNYTQHMQKVCYFLGMSTAWYTPAVKHVDKGLKKRQDLSFKSPNYVRSRLLIRLIRSESIQSEFAQACLISFLFSFRVPSETLQLCRPYRGDRLTESPPPGQESVDRGTPGERLPLPGREAFVSEEPNLRRYHETPLILRPEHRYGSPGLPSTFLVAGREGSGSMRQTPFQAVNIRNSNRTLKAIFARLQVPHASRYSSHAFRRGSAQEMNETGSPLTVVASAGMWRPHALVRNYVDMASTVETNVRQLFRVDPDSESDMEVHSALGFVLNPHSSDGAAALPMGIGDSFFAIFRLLLCLTDSVRLKADRIY